VDPTIQEAQGGCQDRQVHGLFRGQTECPAEKETDMTRKHIPFPTVLICQGLVAVLMLPLIGIGLYFVLFNLGITIAIISVVIISIAILAIGDAVVAVLSLTIWWNVPIVVNVDGISRWGKAHRWEDAESITMKNLVRTGYGPLFRSLTTIIYSNGDSIRFELTQGLDKDIKILCRDKTFLAKLESAKKELGY